MHGKRETAVELNENSILFYFQKCVARFFLKIQYKKQEEPCNKENKKKLTKINMHIAFSL
jgi:hypothetical protein